MVWPERPEQFAEFLEAMAQEPCSRCCPESIYKTLMFLEHAGEVPEAKQMCRAPSVKNALEETSLRLQTMEVKSPRQALLIPAAVIVGMMC